MKKMVYIVVALMIVVVNGYTKGMMGKKMPTQFQAVSGDKATLLQKGKAKIFCPNCGMTLPMFYKTNHAAHVDGKTEQYCSMHCLAQSMQKGLKLTDIKVVDNSTLKFIDANTAWYVVGSSKAATMSKVSKYAFASKTDAEAFSKKFGGKVMNFDDTLASVKKMLAKETAMIKKKQSMMAKKGEMMFNKMCKPVDARFHTVAEAKIYLTTQKPCGELKGKKLQAMGLYLNSRNK